LKNAVISKVALIGDELPWILTFSFVVEIIFGWPGLAQLLIISLGRRDLPVVTATIVVFSLGFILINLVLDLIPGLTRENPKGRAVPIRALRPLLKSPPSQEGIVTPNNGPEDSTGRTGDESAALAPLATLRRHPLSRPLLRGTIALTSACFLAMVVLVAVFAPLAAPYNPQDQHLRLRHLPPLSSGTDRDRTADPPVEKTWFFLLGSDHLGRDNLSRLVFAARNSVTVGFFGVLVAAVIGVSLGLVAGYYRGIIDYAITWVADVFTSVPYFPLALLVLFILGPSLTNIIIALALARWTLFCRVVWGAMLSLRERAHIGDTPPIGYPGLLSAVRNFWPKLMTPLVILAALEIPRYVLLEATLSYLGGGITSPQASWGLLLRTSQQYILTDWWTFVMPGVAIFLTLLSLNLLGNRIRAVKDPLQRWRWL
jgi:peptide/nickel transport system permease protein